jgi:hypothetical protein
MAAGRPSKFKSAEELEGMINNYFESLKYVDSDDRERMEPSTITGLALALGFCDRQSLNDYEKKEEFSFIVKRARLMVENSYEKQMLSKSCTGAIFALKNMGWKDKTEVEQETTIVDKRKRINFEDSIRRH